MNTTKSEATKVMTKKDITEFLKKTIATVANANADLASRVDYALTHLKKATKADLEELFSDVNTCLATIPVENQAKPKIVEEEEIEDEDVAVEADEEEEKPVKKTSKSGKKKPTLKKKKVEESAPASKAMLPIAKFFPEEIKHEDLGKLVAVPDKFKTYEELFKALEEGKTIYFACYWTARQIKEYDYAGSRMVKCPKSFPHDLDLLVACVPCERVQRVWCMSQYTEAMFMFEGDSLEPVEDTDLKTGEQFKIRVSSGMEFELYVPEDEA